MSTTATRKPGLDLRISEVTSEFLTPEGQTRTVGPVSLEIASGEFVSFAGPLEAGGGELLRLIAGVSSPVTGQLLVRGKTLAPGALRVGLATREPSLLAWRTIRDNVIIQTEVRGGEVRVAREKADHLLALAGLSGRGGFPAAVLSQVDAVRVSLCRAFADDPELLLLDDPFHRLDPLARDQVARELQRLLDQTGATVLMASSDITQSVVLSDRVVVLAGSPGRMVRTVPVNLPRPRLWDRASTPRLIELAGEIRKLFEAHGGLA